MAHNTISEIERGARRVDVDDLVALSAALAVSPITLLSPQLDLPDDTPVEVTGSGAHSARQVWEWLRANYPLEAETKFDSAPDNEFRRNNFPRWAFEEDQARESAVASEVDPGELARLTEMVESMLNSMNRASKRDGGDGDD
ncbi:UNVERIFIED_ORG: hypothetical protein L601_000800000500 [Gordonia westfalica J30]